MGCNKIYTHLKLLKPFSEPTMTYGPKKNYSDVIYMVERNIFLHSPQSTPLFSFFFIFQ